MKKLHLSRWLISVLPGLLSLTLLCFTQTAPAHDLTNGLKDFKELPPQVHTVLSKAETYAQKNLYDQAYEILQEFVKTHPSINHPLLSYELGYFSYQQKKTGNAVQHLQTVVKKTPEFKQAWQLLAVVWQDIAGTKQKGETQKEKDSRLKAMAQSAEAMAKASALGDDDDLRYQCALLWLAGEKPKKALVILEPLCEKPMVKQEWYVALSDTMKALNQLEETAIAMEKAAKVQHNPDLLFYAAWLWVELDKPRKSLPLLQSLAEKKSPKKDWLLLLVGVYNTLDHSKQAALVMERVIELDPSPKHLYSCGVLWLQVDTPDRALPPLLRLSEVEPAKAKWFVAVAQSWLMKQNIQKAADAMEHAALISGKPDHRYRAGVLRLQLKQANRAIELLSPLEKLKKTKSEWFSALSNGWLMKDNYSRGAYYMEKAANLSKRGKHYHRAAMLWRVEENFEKVVSLLRKSLATKNVLELWRVDLASVLMDLERPVEAKTVMQSTNLLGKNVSDQLRYRGAIIWRNVGSPEKSYPLLVQLCDKATPQYDWFNTLVKTCVDLEKYDIADKALADLLNRFPNRVDGWKLAVWVALQKTDYIAAAAAKEVVVRFEPDIKQHYDDLSRFYLLAGVPLESAKAYSNFSTHSGYEKMEHLVDIYLSGRHYQKALKPAQQALKEKESPEGWATLGDIFYALQRFKESLGAYEKASQLEAQPSLLIKAAYASMKVNRFDKAKLLFQEAINLAKGDDGIVDSAVKNLAYIERVEANRKVLIN